VKKIDALVHERSNIDDGGSERSKSERDTLQTMGGGGGKEGVKRGHRDVRRALDNCWPREKWGVSGLWE